MPDIFKNWKTTVIGILILTLCIGFLMGLVPLDKFIGLLGGLTGVGHVLGGDGK